MIAFMKARPKPLIWLIKPTICSTPLPETCFRPDPPAGFEPRGYSAKGRLAQLRCVVLDDLAKNLLGFLKNQWPG
ncbi:MAG: hypothetical protein EBX02_02595, partial [Betaproteobacteria bacterium]|nr:hypothetical protein [Betaproteobacteria bacterium]